MRGGSPLVFALLGPSLARAALSLKERDVPATLEVPFDYGPIVPNSLVRDGLERRKNIVNIKAAIEDNVFFHTNLTVGTPPQEMEVYFNLMGNECWMHAANSTACEFYRDQEDCDGYGGYNTSTSKSAEFISSDFAVNDRGPNVTGSFFKDTLTIGNAKVDSMNIGVAYEGITSNTIGLGYGDRDSSAVSLPQALADAGVIKSPAFSMWTEYGYHFGGMILFGGVNKAKYIDTLHTLPIVPGASGQRKAFRVNMTGSLINDTALSPESFTLDAVFDNRVSLMHVPESVVSDLAKQLGVKDIPKSGQIMLPCSLMNSSTNLTFEFGSAKFEYPIGSFITQVSVEEAYTRDYENCYSAIVVNEEHKDEASIVLGTEFMNLLYSVFDLANDEVSLAYRRWDAPSDNIIEITSGEDAVPGSTATDDNKEKSKGDEDNKESTGSPLQSSKLGWALAFAVVFVGLI